jgi:two-component system, OmpR family, response regulator
MRILIVEDDKGILDFLKCSLEGESFAVDSSEDGEKGLFLALTNDYDLIILDNVLPGKEGLEICTEIRKEGKNTPIIILSVKSEPITKAQLLNAGADDYVAKPFSFEELLARIKAILRRPAVLEKKILRIGDLTLDPAGQEVKFKGKKIYLTRKEFCLLEYLMKNRGRVLSRGVIMEHVWDINADPFSNTIESHILNLRKKLAKNGAGDLIATIPARGYKIG